MPICKATLHNRHLEWLLTPLLISYTDILVNIFLSKSIFCHYFPSFIQILKPSEKKAKYQYGGLNSGRPVTPPRGPQKAKGKKQTMCLKYCGKQMSCHCTKMVLYTPDELFVCLVVCLYERSDPFLLEVKIFPFSFNEEATFLWYPDSTLFCFLVPQ